MANDLTLQELEALERYARDQKRKLLMGEALAKQDFVKWARHAAAFLLDKLEDAWKWVRRYIGLD